MLSIRQGEEIEKIKYSNIAITELLRGMLESAETSNSESLNQSHNPNILLEGEIVRNIKKREDGYYEARIQIAGVRKSVYAKTVNEIKKKLKALKSDKSKFERKTQSYDLYSWLELWKQTYKVGKVAPKTLEGIDYAIRQIKRYFKNCDLRKLDALQIQTVLNAIKTERTKEYIFQVFNEAVKKAFKLKLVEENIFEAIDKPVRKENKKRKALDKSQVNELVVAIKGSLIENLILFYLYTGARKSEGLNIKWSDIDFEKQVVHINGTKSKTSNRTIPLFGNIKKILNNIDKNQERLFNFSDVTLKRRLNEIKKNLSFNFTLHQLRHTFATNCAERGVDMKVLQKWLGHSSIVVTSEIYVDVMSEYEKEQAKLINN